MTTMATRSKLDIGDYHHFRVMAEGPWKGKLTDNVMGMAEAIARDRPDRIIDACSGRKGVSVSCHLMSPTPKRHSISIVSRLIEEAMELAGLLRAGDSLESFALHRCRNRRIKDDVFILDVSMDYGNRELPMHSRAAFQRFLDMVGACLSRDPPNFDAAIGAIVQAFGWYHCEAGGIVYDPVELVADIAADEGPKSELTQLFDATKSRSLRQLLQTRTSNREVNELIRLLRKRINGFSDEIEAATHGAVRRDETS